MARRKKEVAGMTDTPKAEAKRLIAGRGLTIASFEALRRLRDGGDKAFEFAEVVLSSLDEKIQRTEARRAEARKAEPVSAEVNN